MKKRKIYLDNTVELLYTPVTDKEMDNLRAIKTWMEDGISNTTKDRVILPIPTVIHNVLADYVHIMGIKNIETNKGTQNV